MADVRRALENDELVPCFQPIIELRTGRLVGFEVLARWQHPESGLVLPANFISLAEESGLIGLLMRQMMRKALLSAKFLPAPLGLALNVSPTQLYDPNLCGQICDAAEKAGFAPSRLTIEITETALAKDLVRAQKTASELKEIGCRLALDDFGTGYSSLRHLQALPIDELKVDGSFVQGMTKTRESRKIVAAIIGLGQSLGLNTVAEWIETEEQAEMLLWLGCELGQGWLYGRPVNVDGILDLISAPPRVVQPALASPGDGWAVSSLEALPMQRLSQLQAIYDGAPVGLCFLDRNLRYVSINRRLAEINGHSLADHLGRTVREMIPDAFPKIEPYLLRALQGEAIADVEITRPALMPGDPDRTALVSYQPALDEADDVIGISIAVVDLSERKRAAEQLADSGDIHQQLFEHNPQVPWMMDAEGNNLQVSSRWVQATGLIKGIRNLGL